MAQGIRYWRVSPKFWQETATWPDDGRILALYLLTCQHRTTEGLFRLPVAYALADLGWTAPRLEAALDVLDALGFCMTDAETSVVLIVKALKYQAPDNPNQVKGAISLLAEVPTTALDGCLKWAAERYCGKLADALTETLSERFGNGCPTVEPTPSKRLSELANRTAVESATTETAVTERAGHNGCETVSKPQSLSLALTQALPNDLHPLRKHGGCEPLVLDDDEVEQEIWKAARDLAKRELGNLAHRPDNVDAYVATVAKAKHVEHGDQLRPLVRSGMSATEAADQVAAETKSDLDRFLANVGNGNSSRKSWTEVEDRVSAAQIGNMEANNARRAEQNAEWAATEPTDEERARIVAEARAARHAALRADGGVNDLEQTR